MEEFDFYIVAIIIAVFIFASIIRKVIFEIDKNNTFIKKSLKETANFSKDEILSLINEQGSKYSQFCQKLNEIFDNFISKMNDKDKANELKAELNEISKLSSDELKDRLLKLLPEFEDYVKKSLGEAAANEFVEKAGFEYNKIFKE